MPDGGRGRQPTAGVAWLRGATPSWDLLGGLL